MTGGINVEHAFQSGSYTLVPVADTGDRFGDFTPYVASLNNRGVVAFQATLKGGGSGVYTAAGGSISTVIDPVTGPFSEVSSHPDINRDGATCFYASFRSGRPGVMLARDGQIISLADRGGPLGPTMNDDGIVAFRAVMESGESGIFTGDDRAIRTIATTGGVFNAFHGLPVINSHGAVVFRADLTSGSQGIFMGDGGPLTTVAETGDLFTDLGQIPIMNDRGTVAFCGSLRHGSSGVFVVSAGEIATVIDQTGVFEGFRGVLLTNEDRIVFYATPRGGELGVFTGPDPLTDCLLSLGAPLFGSAIVDFALNPVSINDVGQIAIRVKLADERQFVVRADPVPAEPGAAWRADGRGGGLVSGT